MWHDGSRRYRPPQNPPKFEPRIYGFKIHESAYDHMLARREREIALERAARERSGRG